MAKSGSVFFPFKEDIQTRALKRSTRIADVFNSAIRCFLLTESMSRFGNPIGSKLHLYLHQLIPDNMFQTLQDEIKLELSEQFKELTFLEIKLFREEKTALILQIRYTSPLTEIIELQLLLQN